MCSSSRFHILYSFSFHNMIPYTSTFFQIRVLYFLVVFTLYNSTKKLYNFFPSWSVLPLLLIPEGLINMLRKWWTPNCGPICFTKLCKKRKGEEITQGPELRNERKKWLYYDIQKEGSRSLKDFNSESTRQLFFPKSCISVFICILFCLFLGYLEFLLVTIL